jgi:SAM-dependent methyltransferase
MQLACPACHEPVRPLGKLLRCPGCTRYYVNDPLPRMLTEDYAPLIDRAALAREARERDDPAELNRFIGALDATGSDAARWGIDDVAYWEHEIYADPREREQMRLRIKRSRPDAGLRTRPREQHIFRHLRPYLRDRVLLDIGCGNAQTIQVLCHPEMIGYSYVGVDLSLSALTTNQATFPGLFVQASATALPFREQSFDAILMLGTLHHLHEPKRALSRILTLLKPGGLIALHEVTERRRHRADGSSHNEAVPLIDILEVIELGCELVDLKREHAVLRHLVAARLSEAMRTRPLLTRAVIALDTVGTTFGRIHPALGPRAVLLTARKL